MILTYSGRSAPSANSIADQSDDIMLNRGSRGDINWGRSCADTELNSDISNVTNKRRMRELFKEHGVPMPKLLTGGMAELPIVGRPDRHTKGRGFWLCKTRADVWKALRGTRRKKAATHFMEYIDAPREYRVHIFLGRSIRISEKVFYVDPFTGVKDKSTYYTGKPKHNVDHVRKAAKQAVKAVGLDFGAVDVLASDSEAWVLEVNAAPGLGGSMPQLYADTFLAWEEGEFDD